VQYFKFFDNSPIANGLIPVVDVDTELSIPSVYSFVLLFIATVLLMVITIFVKRQKGPTWLNGSSLRSGSYI
jgi:hypothetical protein